MEIVKSSNKTYYLESDYRTVRTNKVNGTPKSISRYGETIFFPSPDSLELGINIILTITMSLNEKCCP